MGVPPPRGKDTKSIFQRRFHGRRRCAIVRSLMAYIRGTFFRRQGYKMVGNFLVEVYKRLPPKGLTGAFYGCDSGKAEYSQTLL